MESKKKKKKKKETRRTTNRHNLSEFSQFLSVKQNVQEMKCPKAVCMRTEERVLYEERERIYLPEATRIMRNWYSLCIQCTRPRSMIVQNTVSIRSDVETTFL
jgi:hypothetical protein